MHSTATSQHQNAQLTVHSCCQLKTCSPSLVAVQLLQVVSNAVSLKSAKRSKSLVLKTQKKQHVLALKCFANCWIKVKLAITLVYCCAALSVKISSVVKCWQSQVQSSHIATLLVRSMYCLKMKVVVTHHSLTTTVHSSTSVQRTSLVRSSCQKTKKWSCQAITYLSQ